MAESALGLFATIALIVFILVGIGIGTSWVWKIKASVIVASVGILINSYFSLINLLGWPTPFIDVKQDWVLLHAVVHEPDKKRQTQGDIFLWLRSNTKDAPPRALRLPYERVLHKTIVNSLQKSSEGVLQGVSAKSTTSNRGSASSIVIYDLGKGELMPKVHSRN